MFFFKDVCVFCEVEGGRDGFFCWCVFVVGFFVYGGGIREGV